MTIKKMHRFFSMVDFLEEESFLEQQHQNGWRFVDIKGLNTYVFEETAPEDYVYQLDILEQTSDEEDYIAMCQDYGWEYVFKYNNWYYFRKPKKDNDGDLTLFSDTTSKLNRAKKSIKFPTIYGIVLLFLAYAIFVKTGFQTWADKFLLMVCILALVIVGTQLLKYRQLVKKIKGG
ncbi:DUF2812 domain-containing protein [Streptococcus pacificus]|uniref:DUF2812 domain-containing protein n=1 Tax=Streptococcus pacificus TaxID=2740577 RepID=A0ABS0ZIJ5_9STRE|nr:DUF2812 domain-containing protein [Streptococcus pacificus]MBJ8325826.1 DUF2812 domain-containing protein [Streptococcus pacificus]